MLLLVLLFAVVFSVFFYCMAIASGLGSKRWACAGLLFGPLIWPMFTMKKRMKYYKLFGYNALIWKA